MKARSGLNLAIVITFEVEDELQLWSICQQILKKGLILTVKEPQFNRIWEGEGDQIFIGGEN